MEKKKTKRIYLMVGAAVDVTEDEYEQLRKRAEDSDSEDCPYKDILAPEWLVEKVKSCGEISDGFISAEQFCVLE